jgi:phage terminase small subunit
LAHALIDKEIDAMLIEKAQLEMVYENILDFKNLTRILHEEIVKLEEKNNVEEIDVTNDFFNVYPMI